MVHALYPGSFDPLHNGHLDLIERASLIYDELTIAILNNPLKKGQMFSLEERLDIATEATSHLDNTKVMSFDGLLVEFVDEIKANVIVKGLRTVTDFEYELQMAHLNKYVNPKADTSFMMTASAWSFVSSSRIRELSSYGADVSGLVPTASLQALASKL